MDLPPFFGWQEALGPEVYVFLSDVETDVWSNGTVADLSRQSAKWLVTRGEAGADEFSQGLMQHLPPHKVQLDPKDQPAKLLCGRRRGSECIDAGGRRC